MKGPIYVASRASLPERAEMWRQLRAEGVSISSSWIDEAGPGQTASMVELWTRIENEIESSVLLVLYVEGPTDLPLKGALVEVGMAISCGLEVRIVAPYFSTEEYHKQIGSWVAHPCVSRCTSIDEALKVPPRVCGKEVRGWGAP